MITVTMNGSSVPVDSLELNYKNGTISVSIETSGKDVPMPAGSVILNYESQDLFLISLLDALHTPANLSGYCYLKRALELGMNDPSVFSSITKEVYPVIAKEFNATTAKVERSLHSVIMAILENHNQEFLKEFFGHSYELVHERRNNSYVLSAMINRIKLFLSRHPLEHN